MSTSRTIRRRLPPSRGTAAFLAAAVAVVGGSARAADSAPWELAPYRVRITVAVEDRARPEPGLAGALSTVLADRIAYTVGPAWELSIAPASDAMSRRLCLEPFDAVWAELPKAARRADKLLWLGVTAKADGYEVSCRELDGFTRRWGAVRRQDVPQRLFLAEAAFAIVFEAFRPVVLVEAIDDDDARVRLQPRAGGLPAPPDGQPLLTAGDALAPMLRRTDRSGQLAENGITPVPWTLLVAESNEGGRWTAEVKSGMRRPFGAKRRGLVQQIALALKNPTGATRVRFHARSDAERGLGGYEVFRELADGKTELVGVTDREGFISVPPGEGPISTVVLRSDGQLLAKIPISAGSPEVVEAAIADDEVRLQAQAESRVVREELIDVVARRTIMMARIRAMLKAGRVEDAQELMTQLDQLPTASTFATAIETTARRLPKSPDPYVQRTIDKLFTATRELLSRFLDPRAVSSLQNEVNNAQKGS